MGFRVQGNRELGQGGVKGKQGSASCSSEAAWSGGHLLQSHKPQPGYRTGPLPTVASLVSLPAPPLGVGSLSACHGCHSASTLPAPCLLPSPDSRQQPVSPRKKAHRLTTSRDISNLLELLRFSRNEKILVEYDQLYWRRLRGSPFSCLPSSLLPFRALGQSLSRTLGCRGVSGREEAQLPAVPKCWFPEEGAGSAGEDAGRGFSALTGLWVMRSLQAAPCPLGWAWPY